MRPVSRSVGDAAPQRLLFRANVAYLISMLLVVTVGSLLQMESIGWGLMATEIGLILVPALLWVRGSRLAVSEALPLRRTRPLDLAAGAALGLGAWALAGLLDTLGAALLGYRPPSPFGLASTDPLSLTVFVLALAVAAPICEELLFRGVLLRAYRPLGTRVSLAAVSTLFVIFHFRLQGALALVPLALVTGALTLHTRSLWPAIVAHAVHNGASAGLFVITTLDPAALAGETGLVAVGCLGALGLLASGAAVWRLKQERGAPASAPQPAQRRDFWPLAIAVALYLTGAGLELVQGRFPEWLADPRPQLEAAPWSETTVAAYDLKNVAGTIVGRAACTFAPEAERVAFRCTVEQRRFEVQVGQSFYAGGAYTLVGQGHWQADDMRLLDAEYRFRGESLDWVARLEPDADGLALQLEPNPSLRVPADSVVAAEWPWRMTALPFDRAFFWGARVTVLDVRAGLITGEAAPAVVQLVGLETIHTPTEAVRAYRVRLGRETAWYRLDRPHTLIQFDDGYGVTWTLSR